MVLNPALPDIPRTDGPRGSELEKRESSGGHPALHGPRPSHDEKRRSDGKLVITEEDAWDKLGFSFPFWKKWAILTVVFMVQMSMNYNASVYASSVTGM